jgi:hypothetical protein
MRKAVFSVGPKQVANLDADKRYRTDCHGIETVIQTGIGFRGKCVVFAQAEKFFGGEKARNYIGPILENPTWKALLGQATKAMRCTNDAHHCFFEGYTVKSLRRDGVYVIELFMGS